MHLENKNNGEKIMSKCPYCYRDGIWSKDPILTLYGSKYKWTNENETTLIEVPNIEDRIYKGIYQITEPEVQELQDNLKALEIESLPEIERTVFSPLNTSGYFQITGKHIKEMRDSVEKLLTAIGLTKTDYFNYDEGNNHIIHPLGDKIEWTDPITEATDLQKFQIKAIHFEDLRHNIQTIWQETWTKNSPYYFKTTTTSIRDAEGFNVIADHNWPINYESEWVTSSQANGVVTFLIGSGNLSFNSSISNTYSSIENHWEYWEYWDYCLFGHRLYATINVNNINISSNTYLSWDGTFVGNILEEVYNRPVVSFARIGLNIGTEDSNFYIYFNKYPSGNVWILGTESPVFITLTNWSGNNINLHNLLIAAGKDMTKTYYVKEFIFNFINGGYGWGTNPYGIYSNYGTLYTTPDNPFASSTLNVTLDNLRIGNFLL
jgi:hypothetical protein